MADEQNESRENMIRIPLDGSYGAGPVCEVTIVTKVSEDDDRRKEESFTVPYFLVDKAVLQKMTDINFILGYQIVKNEKINPALKELGL